MALERLLLFVPPVNPQDLISLPEAGLGELNPFMRLAQTWLGAWWLIPKLGLTFVVMWLLNRSNKLYHIALKSLYYLRLC